MLEDGRATTHAPFEAHFRELVGPVRRYASRAVGDQAADDVTNETFTIAWRRWADAPDAPGLRRAWTFKIAHNVVAHHVRSQLRRGQLLRRVGAVRPAELTDPADLVCGDDRVARQLADLPLAEREALALVVWADMSPQQAAYALGCSVGALNSRLTRARKRLVTTAMTVDLQTGTSR